MAPGGRGCQNTGAPEMVLRFALRIALLACLAPLSDCSEERGARTGPAIPPATAPVFIDATREVGLDFAFDRAADGDYFMPDSMAAGCAFFDFDNDGDLDIYVVGGKRGADGALVNPAGADRLYRQEADGRFVDVTASSRAGDPGYGMGVAVGDVNNDGFIDLYVTNYGPDSLWRNNGDGTFSDVGREAGLGDPRWGASAGFVDYDGDGWLDLFVTNYLDYDAGQRGKDSAGRPEYTGPDCCNGVPAALYRNNRNGTFTDVSTPSGIGLARGKGLGVAFLELDGDGRVDIYVANDGESNRAWIQNGDGTFTDRATTLGLAVNAYGAAEASMGVAVGDIDGDLRPELFLTNLVQETNALYRNLGPGRWIDARAGSGLGPPSAALTGFGTAFFDFDLDGDLDLLVVNGRVRRAAVRAGVRPGSHWSPYAEPNLLFENDGSGRFRPAPAACGTLCSDPGVGRGLAVGDVDNDGDVDVLLTAADGRVRFYRNERRSSEHWLELRVIDPATRRDAYGATVYVSAAGRTLRRDVAPASSYLSSNDPRVHFGLGDTTTVDDVRVRWPDGVEERFGRVQVDRVGELVRGRSRR